LRAKFWAIIYGKNLGLLSRILKGNLKAKLWKKLTVKKFMRGLIRLGGSLREKFMRLLVRSLRRRRIFMGVVGKVVGILGRIGGRRLGSSLGS
jgi:small-conductance mechanosensitive channel